MKVFFQFGIILAISFLGELLHYFIPVPIPASIYGLVILFVCLMTRIIKLDMVKDAGKFLIDIMPLMFIPAAVGLMESWGVLKSSLIPVISITVVSTVLVMAVAGRVTQAVIRKMRNKEVTDDEGGKD